MVKGASITVPSGEVLRFGPDERFDIPTGVSWDTEMPGGFGPGQMTVPLPENLTKDDQLLYADVRVYGPGNRTLAEGYVTGVPRSQRGLATVQWAGHSTVLSRIQNFRAIIVDRDYGNWNGPSRARRVQLDGTARDAADPSVEWDGAQPALKLSVSGPVARGIEAGAWYNAGTARIESVYYAISGNSAWAGAGLAATLGGTDDDLGANGDISPGLALDGAHRYWSPDRPRKWITARAVRTAAGLVAQEYDSHWRLAAYGNHGIPLRGADPKGVYAGDVINYIISQSPLHGTLGDSIEETTWVIPHLAWHEDVSLQQAIEDVTAFGGSQLQRNDWGAYEGKEFFWRTPGTYGKTWHVRREQLADPSGDGPDADRRIAGVKVNYQDAAGETRSAGPPGSNSDYETPDLLDADPDNPAHRIPGMWLTVDGGTLPADPATGIPQAAINIGTVVLNDRNRLFWRGTMSTSGTVEDEHGNPYPVAMIRAGDRIVVDDDPDPTEIPVNSTSYTDDGESISLNLGARPDGEETMLAQLAAVTELIPG